METGFYGFPGGAVPQSSAAPTGGGTLALIGTQTLAAATASIDFSGIPQTYTDLLLKVLAKSDAATNLSNLDLQFNGDSGNNYDWTLLSATTSATATNVTATNVIQLGYTSAASSGAGTAGIQDVIIPNYAGTLFWKYVRGQGIYAYNTSAGGLNLLSVAGQWRSTAAITSLHLFLVTGNFVAGSTVILYGRT